MIAQFKRPQGMLGALATLLTALLATQVAAHPIYGDDLAARGTVSRLGLVDLPAVADGHSDMMPVDVLGLLPATAKTSTGAWASASLHGIGGAAAVPLFLDPLPAARQGAALGNPEQTDPLGRALRSVVNVGARRPPGASAARGVLPATEVDQVTPFLVEDIAAAVLKVEEGLAEIITEILDARVDDEGRVTFSLAGVEGFHVTADDRQLSLGHGDTMFAFNAARGVPLERRISALDAGRDAEQRARSNTGNPLRDLIELGVRVLQYPLFWVLVILALTGKLALVIANSQKRRRSRRLDSGSEQPKAKRTRIRTRIKLKRVRTRIRLQQSA